VSRQFFVQALERKIEIRMGLGGRAWRGYPVGGELTSGTPDLKEGLYFGAELDDDHPLVRAGTPMHGRNLFPSRIPLFRETVLDYMAAMTALGHRLMEGMASSLGLGASYFADRSSRSVIPPQSDLEIALGAGSEEEIAFEAFADPNLQWISPGVDGSFLEGSLRRVTQADNRGAHCSGSQP
jgi:hypothetical protein